MLREHERVEDRVLRRPVQTRLAEFTRQYRAVKPNIVGHNPVTAKRLENVSRNVAKFGLTVDVRLLDVRQLDDFFGNLAFRIDKPVKLAHHLSAEHLRYPHLDNPARVGILARRFGVKYRQRQIKPLGRPMRHLFVLFWGLLGAHGRPIIRKTVRYQIVGDSLVHAFGEVGSA